MPILHNFFQKVEEEGTLANSFCDVSTTLILKTEKDITRKENYRQVAHMNLRATISAKY